MASGEAAYVSAFRDFMKFSDVGDVAEMEKEFFGPSTRAVCILQSMWIEGVLESAIKTEASAGDDVLDYRVLSHGVSKPKEGGQASPNRTALMARCHCPIYSPYNPFG
jgi:hypothetical protein